MTKKPETLDCVAVKRRAQRPLARALAGKSPDEQVEALHRLAAQAPLWKSLAKARVEQPTKAVRARGKRRSAG
jgi:hypothetical protein